MVVPSPPLLHPMVRAAKKKIIDHLKTTCFFQRRGPEFNILPSSFIEWLISPAVEVRIYWFYVPVQLNKGKLNTG
jgi:hypothetical protein